MQVMYRVLEDKALMPAWRTLEDIEELIRDAEPVSQGQMVQLQDCRGKLHIVPSAEARTLIAVLAVPACAPPGIHGHTHLAVRLCLTLCNVACSWTSLQAFVCMTAIPDRAFTPAAVGDSHSMIKLLLAVQLIPCSSCRGLTSARGQRCFPRITGTSAEVRSTFWL